MNRTHSVLSSLHRAHFCQSERRLRSVTRTATITGFHERFNARESKNRDDKPYLDPSIVRKTPSTNFELNSCRPGGRFSLLFMPGEPELRQGGRVAPDQKPEHGDGGEQIAGCHRDGSQGSHEVGKNGRGESKENRLEQQEQQ